MQGTRPLAPLAAAQKAHPGTLLMQKKRELEEAKEALKQQKKESEMRRADFAKRKSEIQRKHDLLTDLPRLYEHAIEV